MVTPVKSPRQFRVRYLRLGDAAVQEATLSATSATVLQARLEAEGQTVLSVQVAGNALRGLFAGRRREKLERQAFPLFCREVRTLLSAGMTVVEAVETLSARERLEGRADSLAARLLARLERGLALSGALSELAQTPPVLVAAVRAGERTSNLVEALDDYLRFDGVVSNLRKKVVSAAIYPALVTVVGLAISVFLLVVVMPNFASMYESLRNNSADGAALTVRMTHFIGKHRSVVMGVLLAVGGSIGWWVWTGRARRHAAWLGQKTPWIRRRVDDFQLAMMYQALALLIKGGYTMTQAMQVASASALSAQLRQSLDNARLKVEQGSSVSQALSQASLCDEVGRRLIAAAERNGEFHLVADVVSRLHGERFELFVERVTRIVEPLLLLVVALVVGGIVIMMYMPVFDMATQLL